MFQATTARETDKTNEVDLGSEAAGPNSFVGAGLRGQLWPYLHMERNPKPERDATRVTRLGGDSIKRSRL